jgi:hypothetical protein
MKITILIMAATSIQMQLSVPSSISTNVNSECGGYVIPPRTSYCQRLAPFDATYDVVNVRTSAEVTPYLLSKSGQYKRIAGRVITASKGAYLAIDGETMTFRTPTKSKRVPVPPSVTIRTSSSGKEGAISPRKTKVAYFLLREGHPYDTDRVVIVTLKSSKLQIIPTKRFSDPTFPTENSFVVGGKVFRLR